MPQATNRTLLESLLNTGAAEQGQIDYYVLGGISIRITDYKPVHYITRSRKLENTTHNHMSDRSSTTKIILLIELKMNRERVPWDIIIARFPRF